VGTLVIEPSRGTTGVGEPVDADVGQQLVAVDGVVRERGGWVGPFFELLDDPRKLADRRVGKGVGKRLRAGRLELEVPALLRQRLADLFKRSEEHTSELQ